MKKIILYTIIAFIASVSFTACNDTGPFSGIDDRDFYKTPEDIKAALVAAYNGLQQPLLYEWQMTELRSDNSKVRSLSSNTSSSRNYYQLDQAFVAPNHPTVYEYWRATYANINRCNIVLQHADVITNKVQRERTKGEASFLRAYHYFNLVRLYGPVFEITEPIDQAQAMKYQREPEDIIYKLIKDDLQLAIDSLPADYTNSSIDLGRATSVAAQGMMAKVHITLKEFNEAYKLLDDIVTTYQNSSIYGLEKEFADIFDVSNEMNKEILFAVRYKAGGYGVGSPFPNLFAPNNSGSNVVNGDGSDCNIPTEQLKGSYQTNDKRIDATYALGYYNPSIISSSNPTGWVKNRSYCKKYMSEVVIKSDAENDWPVLRFADILLMYAETINELGNNTSAFQYVNMIKERAGLSGNQLAAPPMTRQQFRTLIEQERRLEFAFENQRWFDLLRTGRAVEMMNTHYDEETKEGNDDLYYAGLDYANMEDYNILLPIPQKEIDVNPSISQNPGY